jgi:hypothetical protein
LEAAKTALTSVESTNPKTWQARENLERAMSNSREAWETHLKFKKVSGAHTEETQAERRQRRKADDAVSRGHQQVSDAIDAAAEAAKTSGMALEEACKEAAKQLGLTLPKENEYEQYHWLLVQMYAASERAFKTEMAA